MPRSYYRLNLWKFLLQKARAAGIPIMDISAPTELEFETARALTVVELAGMGRGLGLPGIGGLSDAEIAALFEKIV